MLRFIRQIRSIRFLHVQRMNMGPVEENIRQKLQNAFKPHYLVIENESNKHNVPKGSETHFKVVIVSDDFEGQPLIQRHRSVNEVLKDNLKETVHALTITARTVKQWEETNGTVAKSPPCMGGTGL